MDENIILEAEEMKEYVVDDTVIVENEEPPIEAEVVLKSAEVDIEEEIEIEIEDAIGWVGGDTTRHYSLNGRDEPDQHPISAITGLRAELDAIEALKIVESNGFNVANYYKWEGNKAYDDYGYFVSMVPGTSTIKICDGPDIFGVSVKGAGFIGGQNAIAARDNTYGLIVTSGLVGVHCELEINVGDYVVSNARGRAQKSDSNYGYKVLALEKDETTGETYAVIALGVQADKINKLGLSLSKVKEQVDANYRNIISATNLANEAYNKATEIGTSNQIMSDKVDGALGKVDDMSTEMGNLSNQVSNSSLVAAQAKAIADSAATYAASIKDEATAEANKALAETASLRDKFALMDQQITDVEDEVTIVTSRINREYEVIESWNENETYSSDIVYYAEDTQLYHYFDNGDWQESEYAADAGLPVAIAGIQVKVDDHSSSVDSLVSWQGEAKTSMARIEQKADANGAYIQSTVTNIDKYAVGPHSQAYGFTRKQAQSVLEEDMIYVPTEDGIIEEYAGEGDLPTYKREFSKNYLYRWGEVSDGYGWITVDKEYSEDKLNTSAPAVYFSHREISMYKDDNSINYGYWYTYVTKTSPIILDIDGNETKKYKPYTLYKWDLPYNYKDEDGTTDVEERRWVAVATLAGNVNNRAVSQIRQDANSIEMRVTNTEESYAGLKAELTDSNATITSLADWKNGKDSSQAIIRQDSSDDGASVVIAALKEEATGDKTEIKEMAKLVLHVAKDSNGNPTSALSIDADHINFKADNYTIDADHINFKADNYTIDADKVNFEAVNYTIHADHINFEGSSFSTSITNEISDATKDKVDKDEVVTAIIADEEGLKLLGESIDITGNVTFSSYSEKVDNSVASTVIEYALSKYSDRFEAVDGEDGQWSAIAPNWQEGSYMWQQTVITKSNGTTLDPVRTCIQGAAGTDGSNFKIFTTNVNSTQTVLQNYIGQTLPWDVNENTSDVKKDDLVMLRLRNATKGGYCHLIGTVDSVVDDNTIKVYTTSLLDKGETGAGGSDGADGKDGTDGKGVESVVAEYHLSNASTTTEFVTPVTITKSDSTTGTLGWTDDFSEIWKYCKQFKFIWTREKITYTDTSYSYTDPRVDNTSTVIAEWCDENDKALINGGHIAARTITAAQLDTKAIASTNYLPRDNDSKPIAPTNGTYPYSAEGTFLDLNDGAFYSKNFAIESNGSGHIGGWDITEDGIDKKDTEGYSLVGIHSGDDSYLSLVDKNEKSDVRFYAGNSIKTVQTTFNITSKTQIFTYTGVNIEKILSAECSATIDGVYEIEGIGTDTLKIIWNGQKGGILTFTCTYYTRLRPFTVLEDGSLYANAADISGTINATEGNIGNVAIQNGAIISKNGNFSVDELGNLKASNADISGTINATEGNIGGWELADNYLSTTYKEYDGNGELSSAVSSGIASINKDLPLAANFTFNSLINDGEISYPRFYAGNMSIWDAIDGVTYSIMPKDTKQTNFVVLEDGSVYVRAIQSINYDEEKTWGLKKATLKDASLGISTDIYKSVANPNSSHAIFKIEQTGSYKPSGSQYAYAIYDIETNHCLRIGTTSTLSNIGVNNWSRLVGTWYSDKTITVDSWRGCKHDIEPIPDKYSVMFDNLKPMRFKYNNDSSDKYRLGYVLDEMKDAMDAAGVDESELAAYNILDRSTGEGGIGYTELIALHTMEIQKLKARVEELENKLNTTQND